MEILSDTEVKALLKLLKLNSADALRKILAANSDGTVTFVDEQVMELEDREEEEIHEEELNKDNTDKHFTYTVNYMQEVVIEHNLNKQPAITPVDESGDECFADIKHLDLNTVQINFVDYFTGTLIFN